MPVRIIGSAALAVTVFACAAEALPCDDVPRRLHGQSPGELRALWRELGVTSRLFADAAPGPLRAALDGRPPYAVVSVTGGGESDWQFLVFTRRADGCRFVGSVDVPAQGPEFPSHRVVDLPDGQKALVVRALARRGTGLTLVRETWYLVTQRGLPVVLDYPVGGHMVGWPSTFDRAFATTAVSHSGATGIDEVQVEFRASYTSGSYIYWMPVEPLFDSTRRAYYTWKRLPRRFVLDPVRSDVYDDEIEGLFHDAEEQFLRHNVQELAQLAERGNDRQQAWLRHFLDSVPDGPEKRAVMENLR